MVQSYDIAAWTSLVFGLFLLASAARELRRPGTWRTMLGEIEASPALQLTLGLTELALGAIIYLANPWNPQDWLAALMTIVGGLMIVESVIFLAFADRYLRFWLPRIGTDWRGWSIIAFLIGLWLTGAGFIRTL